MRLRVGLVAGFAAGAYIATIAQQRSRQLNQQLNQKVKATVRKSAIDAATGKAKAAVDLGVARARDAVAAKLGDGPVRPIVKVPSRLAASQRNGSRDT